jgi:hypothetical protein
MCLPEVQREVVAWASWREKRSGGRRAEVGSQICRWIKISWDGEGDGGSGVSIWPGLAKDNSDSGIPLPVQGEAGKSK